MLDNVASTHKERWHTIALFIGGLIVGLLLIAVTFIVARIRDTYAIEARLVVLETIQQDKFTQHTTAVADFDSRLDALERTIFGDVIPNVDKVKAPLRLEQLHFQNERELRQRVEQLERWRLKTGAKE